VGNESPELIERQMEETRESLTEKVSLLEQQVTSKIQSATDAVQETVETVKSAVTETVDAVKGTVQHSVESVSEGVKEVLDVPKHVRDHPWAMVGGATAAGFFTGLLLFGRRQVPVAPAMPFASPAVAPAASHRPGWLDDLFEAAGREVKKVAEAAIATASASLKQSIGHKLPEFIDRALTPTSNERAEEMPPGAHANGPSAGYGAGVRPM
jgi:ElaB/YqjD/DUF883 family membrane-anchored ribosome-binding protein